MLEEICFGYSTLGIELVDDIINYREVIIPPSIEEEIKESLTRKLVYISYSY